MVKVFSHPSVSIMFHVSSQNESYGPAASEPRRETHRCHICAGDASLVPHLRRDWAHRRHICAGTGLLRATSAPGLGMHCRTLDSDMSRRGGDLFCHAYMHADTNVAHGCTRMAACKGARAAA